MTSSRPALLACAAVLLSVVAAPGVAAPNPVPLPCRVAADTCRSGGLRSGDGRVDPGEEIVLDIPVTNRGNMPATNVRVFVVARGVEIVMLNETGNYGTIQPGETRLPDPPIRLIVERTTSCATDHVLDVTIAFDGGIRPALCTLNVGPDCFGCGPMPCAPESLIPWSAGPYGTELNQTADDFLVPTLEGDTSLQDVWSGCDSHVFVVHYAADAYSDILWNAPIGPLIDESPQNAHYWFMSASRDAATARAEVEAFKVRTEAALMRLSPVERAHWRPRFHHVTTGAYDLGNWISTMLAAHGVTAWAIDPFQKIRQVGLLFAVGGPQSPELKYLTHEVRHFNFEKELERQLAAETFTDVTLWESSLQPFGGGVTVDVDLPDADTMATFDTLQFDLSFECTDPWNSRSCEWDYLANLYICEVADPTRCTEIGRWITAYGQGGRWVTDATPMLALMSQGGRRRFTFGTPYSYVSTLKLRFSNRGHGIRPHAARFLWSGGGFDPNYNAGHPPIDVEVRNWSRRTEIAALITGHGFGDAANCAEFCNHQHRFTVGGDSYEKNFPEAQTQWGCVEQIEIGTNANQYGTWHYGRGGWCPGLDVVPWRADVSPSVVAGTNTITYQGLFQDMDYVPMPGGGGGFGARIDLSSYLVTYVETPEGDCGDGADDDGDGDADCLDQGCAPLTSCAMEDHDLDGTISADDFDLFDGTIARAPLAPLRVDVVKQGGVPRVVWPDVDARFGTSTRVDVVTGVLSEMRVARGIASPTCHAREVRQGVLDPRLTGTSGDGHWYLIRAENAAGSAPFEEPALAAFPGCDP